MRIRSDVDRIRSLVIEEPGESDHYGEMMKAFFRTEKARLPVRDLRGVTIRRWLPMRKEILEHLGEALGLARGHERRSALRPAVGARWDRGDYTVEGVSFYSRPDWPVTALFYLPREAPRPLPAVLVVHGHSFIQKAAPVYQQLAVHLAKSGYAVLAVDFVGGGEREAQGHRSRYMFVAGMTVQGLMAEDNMRAVDYLLTREEVDGKRIGITGSSGGGNQSAFTGILDERIRAVAPVNAVVTYDEHMTVGNDAACSCEVVPGMWTFAEYSDLMATVAPRALLLSQSARDRLFPVKGAREVYLKAREVYRAFGVEDKIELNEDYGPHSYSQALRIGVIRFFDKHLKGIEPRPFEAYRDIITVEDEKSEVLEALHGGLPPRTETLAGLFGKAARRMPALAHPHTAATYRTFRTAVLNHVEGLMRRPSGLPPLDVETYDAVEASWARLRPFSFESERGVIIPSVLIEPRGTAPSRVVLYAHADGKARAVRLREVELLARGGACVLAVDLRGTGETSPAGAGNGPDFDLNRSTLLGRHISMMRAFDVTRAVDALKTFAGYGQASVRLWGDGEASMYALLAFAVDGRFEKLAASGLLLTFRSDKGFRQSDAVLAPGMLLGADVADIVAASLNRRILIANGELPSVERVSHRKALDTLSSVAEAAHAAGLDMPQLAVGGREAVSGVVRRFLLE